MVNKTGWKILDVALGISAIYVLLEAKMILLSKMDTSGYAIAFYSFYNFAIAYIIAVIFVVIITILYYIVITIKEIIMLNKIFEEQKVLAYQNLKKIGRICRS